MEREANVYFVAHNGRIKIGLSTRVDRRLREISTHLVGPLDLIGTMPGSFALEQAIHRSAREWRLKNEWFEDCPELRDVVRRLLRDGSSAIGFVAPPPKVPARPGDEELLAAWADLIDGFGDLLERCRSVIPVMRPQARREIVASLKGIHQPLGEMVLRIEFDDDFRVEGISEGRLLLECGTARVHDLLRLATETGSHA